MTAAATVSFEISKADEKVVREIVTRAVRLGIYAKGKRMDAEMDLIATHANGNPLRLADLLRADDFNFAHDVAGIRNVLDRTTGQLTGFFSPRFTLTEGWVKAGATSTTGAPK